MSVFSPGKRSLNRDPSAGEVLLHCLGIGIHTALATLHLIGAAYNWKRKNKIDVGIHLGSAGYSLVSAKHHANLVRRLKVSK